MNATSRRCVSSSVPLPLMPTTDTPPPGQKLCPTTLRTPHCHVPPPPLLPNHKGSGGGGGGGAHEGREVCPPPLLATNGPNGHIFFGPLGNGGGGCEVSAADITVIGFHVIFPFPHFLGFAHVLWIVIVLVVLFNTN